MKSADKRIAQNTLFMFFRMLITLLITLYISRIVLKVLGVDDFGLYTVVGGVVGMFTFIKGVLSTSTSRFLTFELGRGETKKLENTFSTILNLHVLIGITIIILAETIGLWIVQKHLTIDPDRFDAAIWVYHLSVLTSVITIIQVPFNAAIISHEKMNVFAYLSILDVILKLISAFVLSFIDYDSLILYALLNCLVSLIVLVIYVYYCISNFKEIKLNPIFDKQILRSVGSFSGWSLVGSATYALNSHGTNIITNLFFGPSVVAARAISVQVDLAAMQFVNNFRVAVNPQIIKRYASGQLVQSKKLLLNSTKYSFYLMLLVGLPIILLAEPLLYLWLGQVPDFSVIFVQLIIIQSLFQVFDTSFLTALQAKGRLKENALISPLFAILRFVVVYFMFRAGSSPVVLSYAGIISYAVVGLIIKPILVCKLVDYSFKEVYQTILTCFYVTLFSLPMPLLLSYYLPNSNINNITICVISILSIILSVITIGISTAQRNLILLHIKNQLTRKKIK